MEDHHLQETGEQGDQEAERQPKEEALGEVDGEEVRAGEVMEKVEKAEGEEKRGEDQEEEEKEEARGQEEEKREEEQEENQKEEREGEEEEEQEGRGQWKSLWSGGSLPTRIRSATLTLGSETCLCLETLCRTR